MSGRNSQGFSQHPSKNESSANSSANQYPTYFSNEKYSTQPSTDSRSRKSSANQYSTYFSKEKYSRQPSTESYSPKASVQADAKQRFGLIILGNSGVGKSFLANIFLRNENFAHKSKPTAVTTETRSAECIVGDKIFSIFDIPGLIEADQEQIDRNKREIHKAFKECPNSIVLYVFGCNNGRIRNEDVVAFKALNEAYPFKSESLILAVNCIPPVDRRDKDYEAETSALLRHLLNAIEYRNICFLDTINANNDLQKQMLHDKLLPIVISSLPKVHIKKQDIRIQRDEVNDLVKQYQEMTMRYDEERRRFQLEIRLAEIERQKEMRKQREQFERLRKEAAERQAIIDKENRQLQRALEKQENRNDALELNLNPKHAQKIRDKIEKCKGKENWNFDGSQVTDEDLEVILNELLEDGECEYLSLQNNYITEVGAHYLAEILKQRILKTLFIGWNYFDDEGTEELCEVLIRRNNPLEVLGLEECFTDESVNSIIELIERNRKLTALYLKSGKRTNQISESNIERIKQANETRWQPMRSLHSLR